MTTDAQLLERGTFPDIAVDAQGVEWIAVQENAARKEIDPPALVVYRNRARVLRLRLPIGEAYPKIGQGRVWYRFGDTSLDCLDLATLTPGPFAPLSLIHGTDPVAVSQYGIAWQEALNHDVVVWRQATPDGQRAVVRHGAPTGLSRVLADRVTLVDEDRTIRLPSGVRTRPCWPADGVVVVEQPERGLEVWIDGVGVCVLWPTLEVFTPRAAVAPDGAVHVVAWGPHAGVLVARVTAADCRPYVHPQPWPPPPVPIPVPVPAPPRPPKEPKHMDIIFPPRDQTEQFYASLEALYRDRFGRPRLDTHVDAEGVAVWMEGYLRRRLQGLDHERAERATLAEAFSVAPEGQGKTNPFL